MSGLPTRCSCYSNSVTIEKGEKDSACEFVCAACVLVQMRVYCVVLHVWCIYSACVWCGGDVRF